MTTNEKREPPLSVGFDISLELRRRMSDADRCLYPDDATWLANRITEAVNAARTNGEVVGLERAANAVQGTAYMMTHDCDRRGCQDPDTGEVSCDGEEDGECRCSILNEIADRHAANMRALAKDPNLS